MRPREGNESSTTASVDEEIMLDSFLLCIFNRAVKFTSKLFGRALSRRIKATVLYASETGRSEQYAKQLVELLSHAFNAQVMRKLFYGESFPQAGNDDETFTPNKP